MLWDAFEVAPTGRVGAWVDSVSWCCCGLTNQERLQCGSLLYQIRSQSSLPAFRADLISRERLAYCCRAAITVMVLFALL